MPFVETNGIRMHYETRGSGEPLVLIMGLSADGPVWDLHAQAWEKHFTCYLIDNRGVGRSDAPEGPYTSAMMADDVAGFMDQVGLKQARVAGISMGGVISQQLALRHPQKVRSQILAATWAKCDAYAQDIFRMFVKTRASLPFDDFLALLHLWIFTPGHYDKNLADLQQGRKDALSYAYPQTQRGFAGQAEACITHDTSRDLSRIKQPTLITAGTADIFTPYAFAKELHQGIKGSDLLTFEGFGHTHHWEDLERFNRETTRWLLEH